MYDFAKAGLEDLSIDAMVNNSYLDFIGSHNTNTAEILNKKTAKHKGLRFIVINDKYIKLDGSFHKYLNGGSHNHNDFTIKDFVEVLNSLSIKFAINPFTANLHNLEFGVNITLPFNTQLFLNAIISYKGKEYKKETYNGGGYLLRFEFDQYEIKIYDKGLQYGLGENILRFEIKVKKMEYFNSRSRNIGIYNYTDLLNTSKIEILSKHLLRAFNELLIYDATINIDLINKRLERELLLKVRNPKYRSSFEPPCLKTYYRHIKRFKELNLKYGTNNLQKRVYKLINDKLRTVTNIDNELQAKINNYLSDHELKSVPILTNS